MSRIARPVFAGLPHHVTQRGNRQENVFFSDSDRIAYLTWLGEYCRRHRVDVLAYCLMTNHVHAVLVPASADALERVFRPLHTRYALRVNKKRNWRGHVWQGRFFSSALDEPYLWAAIRYVERNPVRAGLVCRAEDYRWSSAAARCGMRANGLLSSEAHWLDGFPSAADWSAWLAGEDGSHQLETLRQNVERGLPCGSDEFVSKLEGLAGRSLRPRPPGRSTRPGGSEGGVRPIF